MKQKIHYGRNGPDYVIVDPNQGCQVILDRGAAKDVCRFLMKELNIVKAELATGENVFETDWKLREETDNGSTIKSP